MLPHYKFSIAPKNAHLRYAEDDNPLELLLKEIERAIGAGLYYSALAMALTLPDICAALESVDGRTSGKKYKRWYDAHLAEIYPTLTSADCYSLRCGMIHQGRFGDAEIQYARVIFTIPNVNRNVFHNNVFNDALNLDAPIFCKDFLLAARHWYAAMKDDPKLITNIDRLVQMRPSGLAPYMVGMPLIA